jgi:hypothetical protein
MATHRVHVELVIGIAEQFTLSDDEVGFITGHGGIRRSDADLASFEIGVDADVFGFGEGGAMYHLRHDRAWFPLSELAFLPVNFGFRTSGEVETLRSGRTQHLRGFRPVQALALKETTHYAMTTAATGTQLGVEATRTTPLRVQLNRKPALVVAGAELARFYLASLGMVAHQLLVADYDLDSAVAKLVDPERTGWVDENTFEIAPVSPLCDTGSALQLALLLASPDLLQFWREIATNARAARIRGEPGVLDAPTPAATKHVVAHTMSYMLALPGGRVRALRVTRIESDLRPSPFAALIVHLPYSFVTPSDPDDDDVSDEPKGERRQRRLADDLKLNRKERPGRTHIKLAALGQSFRSAFPRLQEVEVRHMGGRERPPVRGSRGKVDTIKEVSTLPPGGNPDICALVAQPVPGGRMRPPVPAETRGNLFDDLPQEQMRRMDMSIAGLPYPLGMFATAILRANSGGYIVREGGSFPLFEMSTDWGAFALLRAGRSRLAAIGWIEVEGGSVCAVELERRHPKEALATGLFARSDGGVLSLPQVAAILRYTCQRKVIDEGLNWRLWPPDGLFADLRTAHLIHHATRSHAIPMSDELGRRARSLVSDRAAWLAN